MVDSSEQPQALATTPRIRGRLAFALAAIFISALSGYIGTALPVFRDALQGYYGLSDRYFGLLLSAGMLPGAFGALAGGFLIDRYGTNTLLRIGIAGQAVGMLLAGVGTRLPVMLAAMIITGFCANAIFLGTQSFLFTLYPGNRRQIVSLQLACTSGLAIVVALLAEYLLYLTDHGPHLPFGTVLHLPFLMMLVLPLTGLVLFRNTPMAPPQETRATGEPAPAWHEVFAFPLITWWVIGLMILHGAGDAVAFSWAPKILGNAASFPVQFLKPGVVVAIAALLYTLSRVLVAVLPERVGARMMLVLPGLLGGGLLIGGLLSRHQGIASVGFIMGACFWSIEYPAFIATLAGVERRRYATAMAVSLLGCNLLGTVCSFMVGWLGDVLGKSQVWMAMLLPAGVFLLTGIAGGLWLVSFSGHLNRSELMVGSRAK